MSADPSSLLDSLLRPGAFQRTLVYENHTSSLPPAYYLGDVEPAGSEMVTNVYGTAPAEKTVPSTLSFWNLNEKDPDGSCY